MPVSNSKTLDRSNSLSRLIIPLVIAVSVAVFTTGCDLDVTNPGPVQDQFLDDPQANQSIVSGIGAAHQDALWQHVFYTSRLAGEYTSVGRGHPEKFPLAEPEGDMNPENAPSGTWSEGHEARWIGENGIERIAENLDDPESDELYAEAHLLLGYANRTMALSYCQTAIDGGEAQDVQAHFDRAEDAFTRVIEELNPTPEHETAAYAGRASVRMGAYSEANQNWEGAISDAQHVPTDFVYDQPYSRENREEWNELAFMNADSPYRGLSAVDSYAEDYYLETGDPRVAWGFERDADGNIRRGGTGGADAYWFFPSKIDHEGDNITLSSGAEMRLIEAEYELRDGNWNQALNIINDYRATITPEMPHEELSDLSEAPSNLPEWEADNLEEAWEHLMRERMIEMWFEGRWLSDLRRWMETNAPGAVEEMGPFEPGQPNTQGVRNQCLPIPNSEREVNPNLDVF